MIFLTAQGFTPNLDGLLPLAIGLGLLGYAAWQLWNLCGKPWSKRNPPQDGTNLGQ